MWLAYKILNWCYGSVVEILEKFCKTYGLVLYRGWPPSEPGLQTSHPQHHQNYIHSTSTPYFSTTMDPILDAIAEIESREPGASFLYRQLAKNINATKLRCFANIKV
jgi:hypothetical protein